MELGALVCRPRRPVCGACPLAAACQARRRGGQADYPRRTAAPRVPERQAVAVVVRRGPAWLMVRRPDGGLLGGLWELPGGARAANEPLPRAVRRGVREQTGLDVAVGPRTAAEATLRHAFSHFTLVLHGVRAERIGGRLKTGGGAAPRWVTPAAFRRLPVATAHRKLLARLGLG